MIYLIVILNIKVLEIGFIFEKKELVESRSVLIKSFIN